MSAIIHIFIARQRGAPMEAQTEVHADTAEGIAGDRYHDPANRKSEDYQITLIEAEAIEAFVAETGLKMSFDAPRRNLVTRGVRLNALAGQRFAVGATLLEGLELCEPCRLFSARTYPEALKWFVSRGGLRARIIRGGTIRVHDPIGAVAG